MNKNEPDVVAGRAAGLQVYLRAALQLGRRVNAPVLTHVLDSFISGHEGLQSGGGNGGTTWGLSDAVVAQLARQQLWDISGRWHAHSTAEEEPLPPPKQQQGLKSNQHPNKSQKSDF